MKLRSDDSITVGSPLRSPLLGYGSDDASSFVPQQGSYVCIPTESLSGCTVASSSQIYVAGKVSIAPSSQQVQSFDNCLLHRQLMRRKRKFSGTVQTASNMGTHIESDSSTSSMVTTLSEMSGTSKQDYNFLSLSDSAVMVRVQQPYSKAVRQLLFNILGSVYNSSIDEQEGSMSGSFFLKRKLYKCNANIYFNNQCLKKQITPSCVNIKVPYTSPAHKYTQKKLPSIKIKDEIRYLHSKKQQLNLQIYHIYIAKPTHGITCGRTSNTQ
jgi:hypothetical protein